MARRKRTKITEGEPQNSLARALEAGENIKGMVGFIPIDYPNQSDEDDGPEEIYVKIRCQGIKTEGCNVKVMADIVGGEGTVLISPCQFVDSPKQVAARKDRQRRLKAAKEDFQQIGKSYYSRGRKAAITEYVAKQLTTAQAEEFWASVEAEQGAKTLDKLADHIARKYAAIVVLIRHGIEGENPEQFERYSWH